MRISSRNSVTQRKLNGARPATSSLPEGTHYLVRQGFHQVRYYLSLAGLDKSFHRHSRHQAHVAESSDLLPAQGNPQRVVGSRGALIDRGIGGNARDQAVQLGCRALIE